ncbi:MAG: PKD domain-containing protein, partial [Thermoplasmata archaeon]|nr:PKD domain-containing protein [Thermoplasmata archaeon]
IVLLVFLGLIFYIASFAMNVAMGIDFGDFENEGIPGSPDEVEPFAEAGDDQEVTVGTTVTLDASASYDDSGEIAEYAWEIDDYFGKVRLYGEVVQYTFQASGDWSVELTVRDPYFNEAHDNMRVNILASRTDSNPPYMDPYTDFYELHVIAGDSVHFESLNWTDDVGIVNYTWIVKYTWYFDGYEDQIVIATMYDESPNYVFENVGNYVVNMWVRDAAGNTGYSEMWIYVSPSGTDDEAPIAKAGDDQLVALGSTVTLDASESSDNEGISDYFWYFEYDHRQIELTGEVVNFDFEEPNMYEIMLVVRDGSGNIGIDQVSVLAAPDWYTGGEGGIGIGGAVSWTSTPFGQDVPFNLLTYVYGGALLASVIYISGLFSKGFAHEIQKGTLKVLFFGPVSVTSIVFSKLLYPITIGPMFIFPLMVVTMSPFDKPTGDILMITLVAYMLVVATMVAAAYGSCLIYAAAKRMVIKPTAITRIFMYLSLLSTTTVFGWMSFLFDMWFATESYGNFYDSYGTAVASVSPFHQGGVWISNNILGAATTPDWIVFAVPALLIVLGLLASRRLYPDIFSRE